LTTQYRSTLGWLKGDSGFCTAGGAIGSGFRTNGRTSGSALCFTQLAAFRVVLKLLVVKKELLPCGKDEVTSAVTAFQYLIGEFHFDVPTATRTQARAVLPNTVSTTKTFTAFPVCGSGECTQDGRTKPANRIGARPRTNWRQLL
jgi:hypothetical protein